MQHGGVASHQSEVFPLLPPVTILVTRAPTYDPALPQQIQRRKSQRMDLAHTGLRWTGGAWVSCSTR
jgi:hypothetical protein